MVEEKKESESEEEFWVRAKKIGFFGNTRRFPQKHVKKSAGRPFRVKASEFSEFWMEKITVRPKKEEDDMYILSEEEESAERKFVPAQKEEDQKKEIKISPSRQKTHRTYRDVHLGGSTEES